MTFTTILHDFFFQILYFCNYIEYRLKINLSISFQTLGNHEFDDCVGPLVSYLDGIKDIPTVVSNLNLTAEPELNKFVLPSLVLTLNNTKVGIVGYLTTDTPVIIHFSFFD